MSRKIRERLESERERLARMLDGLRQQTRSWTQEGLQQSSKYGHHPGDAGTETFEKEKAVAMVRLTERQLHAVEEALRRLDAGEYGRCERCGDTIEAERLEANPAAATCGPCAREDERR